MTGIEPISKLPPYAEPFELTIDETEDIYAFVETLEVPK